ncbi:perlucin-like [Mytilus californianus]|uniref:perlucin-like n=1 Tax=Mytilus californianus TaxID=6549 RepID=UPI002245BDB8|nr:perlucin-like [Mytilus californianus]
MFSSDALSWYLAESSCRGHGARLAEVTTKAQSDYLISMVKILKNGHEYWLGGRDDIIEGTWQWASSDRVFTYTAWGPSNPSNSGGNEDCLHLHDFGSDGIKWNDILCQRAMKFICEKQLDSDNSEIIG